MNWLWHGLYAAVMLFTLLNVRDEVPPDNADPGWYQNPAGRVSTISPESDLKHDGMETS
jgi:hypothetical protein